MQMNYFTTEGWYSSDVIEGRSTEIALPTANLVEGNAWNFTGYQWIELPLVPPVPPASTLDLRLTKRAFQSIVKESLI